jgi:hypothetical protein
MGKSNAPSNNSATAAAAGLTNDKRPHLLPIGQLVLPIKKKKRKEKKSSNQNIAH